MFTTQRLLCYLLKLICKLFKLIYLYINYIKAQHPVYCCFEDAVVKAEILQALQAVDKNYSFPAVLVIHLYFLIQYIS